MGMFGNKKPRFIDLVHGFSGSYIGFKRVMGEAELISPIFVPFNSIKPQIYPESVPESALIPKTVTNPKHPTQMENVMVLIENSKGEAPFLNALVKMKGESLSKMKDRLADKDLEIMTQRTRASLAKSESAKQVAIDLDLHEKHGSRHDEYNNNYQRDRFDNVSQWDEVED